MEKNVKRLCNNQLLFYHKKFKRKAGENIEEVIADLSEPSQPDAAADVSKPQAPYKNGGESINAETQDSSSGSKGTYNSLASKENGDENVEARRFSLSDEE